MGGGLINIVTYGSNDLYLTGVPQITYFKFVYRRYTNFSIESIPVNIEDTFEFNKLSEIIIPSIGDAIHKSYLQIDLPKIHILKSSVGGTINNVNPDTSETDYQKVIEFMELNTKAYRIAMENINIENITSFEIISIALDQFLDNTIDNINNNINTNIINNFRNLIIGTQFKDSKINLQTILDSLRSDIENGEIISLSKDNLYNILQQSIYNSILVQDFYFKKKLESENNRIEDTSKWLKFAWVEKLGHNIIDYIDVLIGGEKIDRHYGTWMDIWYELTGNKDNNLNYNKLIGNISELTSFNTSAKPEYSLFIPLNFWFCRFPGLAFPLVALQYCDLVFSIKLKKISQCCYIERLVDQNNNERVISIDDLWDDLDYNISGKLLINYIFMEHLERRKFAQSSHEYLIETVQRMYIDNINFNKVQVELDFKHPCKELIWIAQKKELLTNSTSFTKTFNTNYSFDTSVKELSYNYYTDIYSYNNTINNYFDKLIDIKNPIKKTNLDLNGYNRLNNFDGNYYNFYQPYLRHKNTPTDGINIYSFSLFPEQHQPSGTCNFSRIPSSVMNFELDNRIFSHNLSDVRPDISPNSTGDIKIENNAIIYIYATNYNILRISGGFAGLSYS